jgi:phosphonate degradation associated HDIG domain protein
MLAPADILDLYRQRGALAYEGEGITQWQHAWQCGRLAAAAGASPALRLAAWLHDLGHLVTGLEGTPTLRGLDDRHEALAERILHPLFGDVVSQPVALHVQAKRYLVGTRPAYAESLSPDSQRSLALQGGPMSPDECADFASRQFADQAVQLRAWDDRGKRSDWHPADPQAAWDELAALMSQLQADHGRATSERGQGDAG